MSSETERTAADVIRDAVRGLCGLPSAEIAWRVVDALGMAGYRIVPLRERTLTACDICGLGYPPSEMVRGYCVGCAEEQMTAMERACERMAGEQDESTETLADILAEPGMDRGQQAMTDKTVTRGSDVEQRWQLERSAELNACYAYQWRCIAMGGSTVEQEWRFRPRPGFHQRLRLRTVRDFARHWLSTSCYGWMPSRTGRATTVHRFGPILRITKPKYWSDCHGNEPNLFGHDPEWTLESYLEHRERSISDWTAEDSQRVRDYYARLGQAR